METKVIEAVSAEGNWGKFLLGRLDDEWKAPSGIDDGRTVMMGRGWSKRHLWVLDLQNGEGAFFMPGGRASADLNKHRIWVCPLFEPFLEWLYTQDLADLNKLPDVVQMEGIPAQMFGYRRQGPPEFLCACGISWGIRIPSGHNEKSCVLKIIAKMEETSG